MVKFKFISPHDIVYRDIIYVPYSWGLVQFSFINLIGEPYARHLMNRVQPPPPAPKKNLWTTTAALKAYYRENFSDWFEPITGRETMARRSSR